MARLRRNTNIASFAPLMVKKSLFIEFLRDVLYKIKKPILKNGAISYLKMKKLNHRLKKWNAMLQIKHAIIPITLNLYDVSPTKTITRSGRMRKAMMNQVSTFEKSETIFGSLRS